MASYTLSVLLEVQTRRSWVSPAVLSLDRGLPRIPNNETSWLMSYFELDQSK